MRTIFIIAAIWIVAAGAFAGWNAVQRNWWGYLPPTLDVGGLVPLNDGAPSGSAQGQRSTVTFGSHDEPVTWGPNPFLIAALIVGPAAVLIALCLAAKWAAQMVRRFTLRGLLVAYAGLVFAMCAFPPWMVQIRSFREPLGYSLLVDPPLSAANNLRGVRVDYGRLALQILAVTAGVSAVGLFALWRPRTMKPPAG